MAITRIIDCIGASDEDMAHLRLLLRSSKVRLRDLWRWGREDRADLVVVDAGTLIGADALRRSQRRGIAWAQLVAAEAAAPEGAVLRKPLRRDDFVALLNSVGDSSEVLPLQLVTQGEEFFNLDLGEAEFDDIDLPALDFSLTRNQREREQDAFDALFHRDPLAEKPQFLMPDKLEADADVEFILDPTRRSAERADAHGNPLAREVHSDGFIDPDFRHDLRVHAEDNDAFALAAYLEPGLLGGPATIQLPGAPALVLDPKENVFHAEGRLPALEPYFRQPLRYGGWKRLVNSELARWRDRVPARPYLRLTWMQHYLGSDGYLAKHLDPGGSYRLKRWLELAHDYPRAFRVGANMGVARRLGDIARTSDVPLAEVFDIVNAYDAIGYIDWTRRSQPGKAAGT